MRGLDDFDVVARVSLRHGQPGGISTPNLQELAGLNAILWEGWRGRLEKRCSAVGADKRLRGKIFVVRSSD